MTHSNAQNQYAQGTLMNDESLDRVVGGWSFSWVGRVTRRVSRAIEARSDLADKDAKTKDAITRNLKG